MSVWNYRAIGVVCRPKNRPAYIKWESGERELLDPDKSCRELIEFKNGQRFEACVVRRSCELVAVVMAKPIKSLPTRTEAAHFWEKVWPTLKTSNDLPSVDINDL